jgi:hypothetical protein
VVLAVEAELMPGTTHWLEQIWREIDIYDGPEAFVASASRFPRPLILLYAAHFCQSEVCNGGFAQFFDNSTGVLAPEAVEGLVALGLHELGGTVSSAMRLFGSAYPRDREERQEAMTEEMFQAFEPLNERFYALIEGEGGGFHQAADRFAEKILPKT